MSGNSPARKSGTAITSSGFESALVNSVASPSLALSSPFVPSRPVSRKHLDSIADLQRYGFKLRVECACGRVRVIEPGDLMVALGRRRNKSRQMSLLVPRLRCFECGGRPSYWGPV
jgi:hypothetical protein